MRDASVMFAGDGPDDARAIRAWRLEGRGDGPRAHVQAGVHADEIPPMLVAHHLLAMLRRAEAEGRLRGTVTIVPQANPIGLRQFAHGRLLGRFDAATGRNFNRRFAPPAAGDPAPGVAAWQAALLALSEAADIVLDLHTDDEALPYVYLHTAFWPAAADLAACLGAAAAILWDGDGGGAFEDAVAGRWLAEGRTAGRLAATVELRGQADVSDALALADARALHRLLCARGVIDGDGAVPPWRGEPVPIAHMQTIRAPAAGIVVFTRELGARLAAGEPFARLVPRPDDPDADLDLAAPNAGLLLTRTRDRYTAEGGVVAKLTGDAPFPAWSGGPLDD